MRSGNRIIMCAAGGGKTTTLAQEAHGAVGSRCALVTYTINNQEEIHRKLYDLGPALPLHVEVMGWFAFLLRELARPYRAFLHGHRIESISWQEGQSALYAKHSDIARHYFYEGVHIYSDKIAKFVCECDRTSSGMVMRRLKQRFDHIFIDEVQDLAGYDLEVVELMLKSGVRLTMVGDHRQATIRTNNARKNAEFKGPGIVGKFREWDRRGLARLSYQQHTHRCHQHIANLGDSMFPQEPGTKSLSEKITGHDGVFVAPTRLISSYVERFAPQVLRLDKRTSCSNLPAMNFGESKGLSFDRVLIFPHGGAKDWLSTGKLEHIEKSAPKMYVGVTRARYSVTFVFDGSATIPHVQHYS